MLRVEGVTFAYRDGPSFTFDLTVARGEIVTLSGESGSGKSTLIDLICGFLTPVSGRITWDGRSILDLAPAKRPVTALFQDGDLFDHLDVEMNIALGIDPRGRMSEPVSKRIAAVLDEIGLSGYQRRRPDQLSGGQRQRVALARAVLSERPLLLLDEPFSALDAARRKEMADLVRKIARDRELATMVVSHDPADADSLESRAVEIIDGRLGLT